MPNCIVCGKAPAPNVVDGKSYCDDCLSGKLPITEFLFEHFPGTWRGGSSQGEGETNDLAALHEIQRWGDAGVITSEIDGTLGGERLAKESADPAEGIRFRKFAAISEAEEARKDLQVFEMPPAFEVEVTRNLEDEQVPGEDDILPADEASLVTREILLRDFEPITQIRREPSPRLRIEPVVVESPETLFKDFPQMLEPEEVSDILGTNHPAVSRSMRDGPQRKLPPEEENEEIASEPHTLAFFKGAEGLYAVDAQTGRLRWTLPTESPVTSTPATGYGKVFFGCYDGRLYAVDIQTRQERWNLGTGDLFWSRFRIADALICFGSSDGHFYAVDVDTGMINWKFKTNGRCQSVPVIAEGVIYFGSDDGSVYALDLKTGKLKWSFDKGDHKCASVSVADGVDKFSELAQSLLEEVRGDADKAFHVAAREGHADALKALLPRVSNINVKDKLGYTALMKAAAFGHFPVVKMLLEYGADVNAGGLFGETPLTAADEGGHTEIAELLKAHGATK